MIRVMCMAAAVALALAACATTEAPPTAVGHQPAEEAAILAVMDAYMHEISANDLAAMDARQTAEDMTYRIRAREDGGWDVVARPNSYWVAPERADDSTYRERYWSPIVMIRGGMALVWAPYEFQIDGVWKVSNAMWTVEPNACAELRPLDPTMIRPRD